MVHLRTSPSLSQRRGISKIGRYAGLHAIWKSIIKLIENGKWVNKRKLLTYTILVNPLEMNLEKIKKTANEQVFTFLT